MPRGRSTPRGSPVKSPTRRPGRPAKNEIVVVGETITDGQFTGEIFPGAVIRGGKSSRRMVNGRRSSQSASPSFRGRNGSTRRGVAATTTMSPDVIDLIDSPPPVSPRKSPTKKDAKFNDSMDDEGPSTSYHRNVEITNETNDHSTNGETSVQHKIGGGGKKFDGWKDGSIIRPKIFEDVHLGLLVGANVEKQGTVKDIVSLANLKKLSFESQQYLLKFLPTTDTKCRADGTLEPTFSALLNEYLSAALLDFHDRLYSETDQMFWLGEITELPTRSRNDTKSEGAPGLHPSGSLSPTNRIASPPAAIGGTQGNSPSASSSSSSHHHDHPPLPKLRINIVARKITMVPHDGEQSLSTNGYTNGAAAVNVHFSNGGDDEASSNGGSTSISMDDDGSGEKSDFRSSFAPTATATVSATRNVSSLFATPSGKRKSQSSSDSSNEVVSLRGRPPACQKPQKKYRR